MDSPNTGLPIPGTGSVSLLFMMLLFALGSGYFSLIETAISESRRGTLERMKDDGSADARAALSILENRKEYLSLVQVGITLMSVLAGLFAGLVVTPSLARLLDFLPYSWMAALCMSIAVIGCGLLLLGEFLPKKMAQQTPERVLVSHHRGIRYLNFLVHPAVSTLSSCADTVLLLLGMNPKAPDQVTEDEVKELIEQGTEDGTIEKAEQYMVDRVFHLGDQTAYALMTPRTQMLWLDLTDSPKHNLRVIRENDQTVFPVGKGSLDDFCGVLYAKDLLDAALDRKPLDLSQYIRKPMFVPRSMEAFRLLEKFRDSEVHEAVVLDEYGGAVGFITLGDLMTEIIGGSGARIEPEPAQITQRDGDSWYVDGLCSIDDFKQRFGIEELPEEEHDHFQTMGGFLTSYFGYIPKTAEVCEWNGLRFEVADMDRARIDKIIVSRVEAGEGKG